MLSLTKDYEIPQQFPIGMRVLAVDHDQTSLCLLTKLLTECQYQVTATSMSNMALELLRDEKNSFDLIITEIEMPDMDGFKFLQLIAIETDIPVIVLSSNSDLPLMLKVITKGAACNYLVKPVHIEVVKNIWIHVIRTQIEKKNNGNKGEKRGNPENELRLERQSIKMEINDLTTQKKPRVVWTKQRNNKFVEVVNQLGIDEATPKKILELMDEENLTRANVASHLQKYRLNLKKTEENQQSKMGIVKRSNVSSHISQNNFNGFHHQPIDQSHQLINNIRPIPAHSSSMISSLPSNGHGFIDPRMLQIPHDIWQYEQGPLYGNHFDVGNHFQGLPLPVDNFGHLQNNLLMPPIESFVAGHEHSGTSLIHGCPHQVCNDFPMPSMPNLGSNQTDLQRSTSEEALNFNNRLFGK